jgi:ATP-dependent helicase/nuclease subunit B
MSVVAAAKRPGASSGACWPSLLEALLDDTVVRPRLPAHPRLSIWGPLEARMQGADLIVLGGLNEGVWPPAPREDPWLSRPMRKALGLPPAERRVGLSAHDFVQVAAAPRVLLTWSQKIDGVPAAPARWLQRVRPSRQRAAWTRAPWPPSRAACPYALRWTDRRRRTLSAGVPCTSGVSAK